MSNKNVEEMLGKLVTEMPIKKVTSFEPSGITANTITAGKLIPLEEIVADFEKRIAALEGQVQAQPKDIDYFINKAKLLLRNRK